MILNNKNLILKALSEQQNSKEQFQQFQYKKFDENWIVDIASFLPSVDKITRDLRSNLRYEEEVLPVEKTRRVTSESIRHLLRNTRYIRDIEENHGIIPEKVLNTLSEIDYGIYENRFIMTLIERLNTYLSNRLEILKDNLHGFRETYYKFKNEFEYNNTKFGLNINMIAVEDLNLEELDLHNHLIYERTVEVFQVVSRMYNSDFMRTMKRYPKVKPPIMKTQIILKNPDFRNAYLLWIYLDRVHTLEYTLESETKTKKISFEYTKLLNDKISELLLVIIQNTNFGNKQQLDEKIDRLSTRPIILEDQYVGNLNLDNVNVLDLEPALATEFYLDKAKEQFHENYKRITKRSDSLEQSLRQVLLDQYSIADQVFEHYFNTNQDKDVFEELMKHRDPVKRYYEAYEKHQITKVGLDVKERIYNRAIELEEKWRLELNDLEIEAKAELRRRQLEADLKFDEIKASIDESKHDSLMTQHQKASFRNNLMAGIPGYGFEEELEVETVENDDIIERTSVSNNINHDDGFNEFMKDFRKQAEPIELRNDLSIDEFSKMREELIEASKPIEEKLDEEFVVSESEKLKKYYQDELEKLRISEEKRFDEEIDKMHSNQEDQEEERAIYQMKKGFREAVIKIKNETNAKINETVRKEKKK